MVTYLIICCFQNLLSLLWMYKPCMPGHLGNKPMYVGTQHMGPQYAKYFMSLFWHLQLSSGSYAILKFVDTSTLWYRNQRQYHEHSHITWFWLLWISQFLRKRHKFCENWQVAEVLLMQHIQCQLYKAVQGRH
jgi:hypothetical protein